MFLIEKLSGRTLVKTMTSIFLLIYLIKYADTFYKQADYYSVYYHPWLEFLHAGVMYTTERSRAIPGSEAEVMDPYYTPDFRIQEPPYTRYQIKIDEEERPYRISPHHKQTYYWQTADNADMLGCACTTVYKKYHLLAACAVITTKHILTTATSTELVLRKRRHFKHLQDILGLWYDTDMNTFNSSMYATPARIHYHPKYIRPENVNRSHPLPAVFDLAVWTATYKFYGGTFSFYGNVVVCPRGGSHWLQHSSAVPKSWHRMIIVGYQFMKAFRRYPMPWFKYAVRTRKHYWPCPKVEWGWFNCIRGNWAKLGLDSGAPMFRALRGEGWLYDGLIGINIVSMRLRSLDMVHYFQVLDSHVVLDFLYRAYMGYFKYEFLDYRFEDTRDRSPIPKNSADIYLNYTLGHEYYTYHLPTY